MADAPIPSLDEFLAEVKPLNPTYSNTELIDAYHSHFGVPRTEPKPRATLPTFEEFNAETKPLNPLSTKAERHQAWQDNFGVMGAREKKPGFWESVKEGLKKGGYNVLEAEKGLEERQLHPDDPLKKFARETGDQLSAEAAKHGVPEDLQSKPFWDRVKDPEYMGNFLGSLLPNSAPSLAGAVVGGVVGGPVGAAAGMAGVTFFQEAGASYREAYNKYKKVGMTDEKAHANAYEASGIAGAVSGLVNSLAVPASLMSPAKSVVKNLFMRYIANVGVDTADQATGNIVAKETFDPERKIAEGVPEAIVGSALLGGPETMGVIKSAVRSQRSQPDQGIRPDNIAPTPGPAASEGLRDHPLRHADPVLHTKTVDDAIETAKKVTDDIPIDLDALKREVGEEVEIEKTEAAKTADSLAKQAQIDADKELVGKLSDTLPDWATKKGSIDVVDPDTLPHAPDELNPNKVTRLQYQAISDLLGVEGKRLVLLTENAPFAGVVNTGVSDSTVFMNVRTSQDPAKVAFHEVQHLLQKSEVFETYRATIREELTTDAFGLGRKYHPNAPTDDAVFNEISADIHGHAMTRPSFHRKLIDKLEAQQGPDVAQTKLTTFLATLKDMIARLKQHLTGRDPSTLDASGKAVAERYVKNLERVHDALASAIATHYRKKGLLAELPLGETSELGTKPEQRVVLDPDVVERFAGLTPPDVSPIAQVAGKGVMSAAVQHLNDATRAMTSAAKEGIPNQSIVKEKVDAALKLLGSAYGFEKEHRENMEFHAKSKGTDKRILETGLDTAFKEYLEAHRRTSAYNLPQWLAREAAIAIGEKRFANATTHLQELKKLVDSKDYAKQAFQYNRNNDGQLREYMREVPGEMIIEKKGQAKKFRLDDGREVTQEEMEKTRQRVRPTKISKREEIQKENDKREESAKKDQRDEKSGEKSETATKVQKEETKVLTPVDELVKDSELQEAFGADTKEVNELIKILDNPAPRGKIQAAEARLQELMSANGVSQKTFNAIVYQVGEKEKPESSPKGEETAFMPNQPTYHVTQPGQVDAFVRKLQDKHIDLKRLIQAMHDAGHRVPDELNPVFREEMFHKRAEQRTTDFTNQEMKPVIEYMQKHGISLKQIDDYLHARHVLNDKINERLQSMNPDLMNTPDYEKLAGITDDEARAILKQHNAKIFEPLARQIDAIVEKTRDMMVDYGLESQERIDTWREQYRSYVPLHREGFEGEGHPTGTGLSVRGTTAQDRLGSALKVVNVLANIAQQRDQIIARGEKNRIPVALAGLILKFPNKDLFKLDKYAPVTTIDPTTGLEVTIPGDLADYKRPTIRKRNPKTNEVEVFPDPTYKGRDNVVNFRIQGKDYAIIFNEKDERAMQISKGLKNLDTPQLNSIFKAVAPYTRYMASINTQYNPIFGTVNFVRDAQFAALALSSTELAGKQAEILSNARKSLGGIWQDARAVRRGEAATSQTAQMWERFQHVGGPTGYRDLFFTSTERAEELQRMLTKDSWKNVRSLSQFIQRAESTWLGQALSDYNLMMENAIRLGVFMTAVDMGLSDIKAASLAKNITVNFNRKGQVGAQWGALYAFFNANVQGTARIAETLFERVRGTNDFRLSSKGKQIIVGGLLIGVLQAAGLTLAGFDDDQPPEYIKNRNLVIPAPGTDNGYLSVPMPLGFNLLPTVGRLAAESLLQLSAGRSPKVMEKGATLMAAIMDTFNPLGASGSPVQVATPTVGDPFVALYENKDWTGKQIYHEDHSDLRKTPGHTRAKDTASIWAIGLSKAINWATGGTDYVPGLASPSPDAIDYLVGQATGGVGREVTKAAQLARSTITGEDIPPYKIPAVGRFVGSAGGTTGVRDKFYDHVREVTASAMELEGRMKHGEDAKDFFKEHPEATLKSTALKYQKQLAELRREKHQLISEGASKATIQAKEKQMTNMMQLFNEQVERTKGRK